MVRQAHHELLCHVGMEYDLLEEEEQIGKKGGRQIRRRESIVQENFLKQRLPRINSTTTTVDHQAKMIHISRIQSQESNDVLQESWALAILH